MPILSGCCCCDLRNGSMACAIYSMIYAALALGTSAYKIHQDVKADTLTSGEEAFFIATCVDVAFFSLLFVFSLLLLYGVKNTKRRCLLPYIVCMSILAGLQAILMLLLVIIIISAPGMGGVFQLLVLGFFTALNVYCILCVISHYQDLRDGRGDMRAVYRAQGTTITHATADSPPEKSSNINHLENANFVPQYPGPPAAAHPYPGAAVGAPPPYQPPEYPGAPSPKAGLMHQV